MTRDIIDSLLKTSDGSFFRVSDVEDNGNGGIQTTSGDILTDPLNFTIPAVSDQQMENDLTDEQSRIRQRPAE